MARLHTSDRATLMLAAASGSRSLVGPTTVSRSLHGRASGAAQPARALAGAHAAALLGLLATGELVGDKMPWIPSRVTPPALGGRIAMGALAGAAIAAASGRSRGRAALIGGVAAAISAVLTYRARRWLTLDAGIPDPLVAIAEDMLVLRLARRAARDLRRAAEG